MAAGSRWRNQQPRRTGAGGARGHGVVALALGQDDGADAAGDDRPAKQREDAGQQQEDLRRRQDQRHHRAQRQRHVDRRQHEDEFGEPRQHGVDPAGRLPAMPPISAPSQAAASVAISATASVARPP